MYNYPAFRVSSAQSKEQHYPFTGPHPEKDESQTEITAQVYASIANFIHAVLI